MSVLPRLSFFRFAFVGMCVCLCVFTCAGQGIRHAALYRPSVPVNGGAANDTTAADGRGSEVAGGGGKAAGNTHCTHISGKGLQPLQIYKSNCECVYLQETDPP